MKISEILEGGKCIYNVGETVDNYFLNSATFP